MIVTSLISSEVGFCPPHYYLNDVCCTMKIQYPQSVQQCHNFITLYLRTADSSAVLYNAVGNDFVIDIE